jgi:glycoprotease/Kae1 family metallohydrolase
MRRQQPFLCLGIESTAHTFGAAVVRSDGTILSNEKDMHQTDHGGMIPNAVKRHHLDVKEEVVEAALKKAKVSWHDIALISVARAPGLPPALRVGLDYAKLLAIAHDKPLIGINHCVAHLTIGELTTGIKDPVFIYVSGVNTQVIALSNKYLRVLGETLDVGLGNALDKFGREMDLGFPAGPTIEKLALKGKHVELPYAVKGMDVSFSGIVTKAATLAKQGTPVADLCFSLQETCFAMVCEVAERALAHTGKKNCVLIGGVAANKRFCAMMHIMCKERGATFAAAPLQYAGDQGAMIAWQGILEHKAGRADDPKTLDIDQKQRVDDVRVTWQ